MKIAYFREPAELRRWFTAHRATAVELWVGYFKKDSSVPSITWPESVDEALCVGWIDGLRKTVDARRYTIRFTPRKSGSIWSAINMKRAEALIEQGRMRPAGAKAYQARTEHRSGIYSYEQRPTELVEPYAKLFRRNKSAWAFFQAQPPGYRKKFTWWVLSAKTEATRLKRVAQLIEVSAEGRRL